MGATEKPTPASTGVGALGETCMPGGPKEFFPSDSCLFLFPVYIVSKDTIIVKVEVILGAAVESNTQNLPHGPLSDTSQPKPFLRHL